MPLKARSPRLALLKRPMTQPLDRNPHSYAQIRTSPYGGDG